MVISYDVIISFVEFLGAIFLITSIFDDNAVKKYAQLNANTIESKDKHYYIFKRDKLIKAKYFQMISIVSKIFTYAYFIIINIFKFPDPKKCAIVLCAIPTNIIIHKLFQYLAKRYITKKYGNEKNINVLKEDVEKYDCDFSTNITNDEIDDIASDDKTELQTKGDS